MNDILVPVPPNSMQVVASTGTAAGDLTLPLLAVAAAIIVGVLVLVVTRRN